MTNGTLSSKTVLPTTITLETSREEVCAYLAQHSHLFGSHDCDDLYERCMYHVRTTGPLGVEALSRLLREDNGPQHKAIFYEVVSCHVKIVTNNGTRNACAFVRLRRDGCPVESRLVRSQVGEIDACLRATQRALNVSAQVTHIHAHTMGEGTDAPAHVRIALEEDGIVTQASAVDTSTTMAALKTYVEALNALARKDEKDRDVLPSPFSF